MTDRHEKTVPQTEFPKSRSGILPHKRFLIVGLVVVAALVYLGFVAFRGAAMYYLTVDELQARGDAAYDDQVRVTGMVVEGSAEKDSETNTLHFALADKDGTSLPVVYSGAVPDAFKQGSDVVVEGSLKRTGTFEADTLLVKCPSKYEAETDSEAAGKRD
jgi:cytochrome c-type biogenesis protein CcmE